MPHKPGANNCRNEAFGSGGNIKYDCGECQACKDRAFSSKLAKTHEYGKFCRYDNNCTYCCTIKLQVRLLHHISGRCFKNCPACKDRHLDLFLKHINGPNRLHPMPTTIRGLYRLMFGLMPTNT
jgi:hypothetical protein